jgi:hypothetical protein
LIYMEPGKIGHQAPKVGSRYTIGDLEAEDCL